MDPSQLVLKPQKNLVPEKNLEGVRSITLAFPGGERPLPPLLFLRCRDIFSRKYCFFSWVRVFFVLQAAVLTGAWGPFFISKKSGARTHALSSARSQKSVSVAAEVRWLAAASG